MALRKIQTKRNIVYVVKLSGSLFFSKEFEEFVKTIRRIAKSKRDLRLILVAGGGPTARHYIKAAKRLGADETTLDELGIEVSRLNALVLASTLGEIAYPTVPRSLAEITNALEVSNRRVVVVGGLYPGQSTNAVAALIAEKTGAKRFFNTTDVDAVYTKNPRLFKNAKKLSSASTNALAKILRNESMRAGGYDLMDPVALKLIERSKVPTTILKGDPKILEEAILKGKKHGTRVFV